MKYKIFRVKKEFIYENDELKSNKKFLLACNLGYTFVKDGDSYYQVHIHRTKTKGEHLIVELVELEIVGLVTMRVD